jgi:DUF1365 family protein
MQFNIYVGSIFHQRVFGKKHQFKYKFFSGYFKDVYNFKDNQFSTKKFSRIFSLDFEDDGTQATIKAIKSFIDKHQIDTHDLNLDLLRKPNSIFIKAFNPVCFWYLKKQDEVLGFIADVTNTFGEKQIYFIDNVGKGINSDIFYQSVKKMYVSPFAKKSGTYKFKISDRPNKTIIKEFNDDEVLEINTVLKGSTHRYKGMKKAYFYFRIIISTLLVVVRIHLHALFIWQKGNQAYSHNGNGYAESNYKKLD